MWVFIFANIGTFIGVAAYHFIQKNYGHHPYFSQDDLLPLRLMIFQIGVVGGGIMLGLGLGFRQEIAQAYKNAGSSLFAFVKGCVGCAFYGAILMSVLPKFPYMEPAVQATKTVTEKLKKIRGGQKLNPPPPSQEEKERKKLEAGSGGGESSIRSLGVLPAPRELVSLKDGSILLLGSFGEPFKVGSESLGPVLLLKDGLIDTVFNPAAAKSIRQIVGEVSKGSRLDLKFVGELHTQSLLFWLGSRYFALLRSGEVDTQFVSHADPQLSVVQLGPEGRSVYLGRRFAEGDPSPVMRRSVERLNERGVADTTFSLNELAGKKLNVEKIFVQGTGEAFVLGHTEKLKGILLAGQEGRILSFQPVEESIENALLIPLRDDRLGFVFHHEKRNPRLLVLSPKGIHKAPLDALAICPEYSPVAGAAYDRLGQLILSGSFRCTEGGVWSGLARVTADDKLDKEFSRKLAMSKQRFAFSSRPPILDLRNRIYFLGTQGQLTRFRSDGTSDDDYTLKVKSAVEGKIHQVLALATGGTVLIGEFRAISSQAIFINIAHVFEDGRLDLDFLQQPMTQKPQ
jgi:hypothetical protein